MLNVPTFLKTAVPFLQMKHFRQSPSDNQGREPKNQGTQDF